MRTPLPRLFLLVAITTAACAKQSPPAEAPATQTQAAAAPAPAPRVVNLVGDKHAFWSPWNIPGLETLPWPGELGAAGLPSALPSAFPWPLPSVALPAPTTTAAPSATPAPTATTPPPAPKPAPKPAQKKAPQVILYGADWCGHCKNAKAHIESRGIAYTYRNVDDPKANSELSTKLSKSGQTKSGIPTTDIKGDLLVGWSAQQFDQMYDAKAK